MMSPPVVLVSLGGEILGDVRPSETTTEAIERVGAERVQWIVTVKLNIVVIYKPPVEFNLVKFVLEAVSV